MNQESTTTQQCTTSSTPEENLNPATSLEQQTSPLHFSNLRQFKLQNGRLVEDSDIGPENSKVELIQLKSTLIVSLVNSLLQVPNLVLLATLILYSPLEGHIYFVFSLPLYLIIFLANILVEVCLDYYFWTEQFKRDNLWSNTSYKIYCHQTKMFKSELMKNIKISDLVVLKQHQYAPADLLVLDSGTVKLDKKIFKATQDALMGNENLVRYAMTKFISMNSDENQFKNSIQKVQSQISKLQGVIQYKHPNTCIYQDEGGNTKEQVREIIGTLKLANDPKMDLIKDENMIYFGSQLDSSWIFGIVLYNGMNTKALRETRGKFSLAKLLISRRSLLASFHNKLAVTILLISLLVSIVSYISSYRKDSDSGFLDLNSKFPHLGSVQRFLLYFINTCSSVCYFIPLINSVSNFLQYREVQAYNNTMQDKKDEKSEKLKQERLKKKQESERQKQIQQKLKFQSIASVGSKGNKTPARPGNITPAKQSKMVFEFLELNGLQKDISPNNKRTLKIESDEEEKEAEDFIKHTKSQKFVQEGDQKLKPRSMTMMNPPTLNNANTIFSKKKKPIEANPDAPKRSNEALEHERQVKENTLKERIIIRHPETLSNLSCIDSVIFSVDGVLTTGSTKIMAVSTLSKNYFLDVQDPLEDNENTQEHNHTKTKGHEFKANHFNHSTQNELQELRILRTRLEFDSKFYNTYKEQVEVKEGNNGIKEEEVEKYSEKSQEFERELDGDFIGQVFDEDSIDSIAFGKPNHSQIDDQTNPTSQIQQSVSKLDKSTSKIKRKGDVSSDQIDGDLNQQDNKPVNIFERNKVKMPTSLFSPLTVSNVSGRNLSQMSSNILAGSKIKNQPSKKDKSQPGDIPEDSQSDDSKSVDTIKMNSSFQNKQHNQIFAKLAKMEEKFKQKISLAKPDLKMNFSSIVVTQNNDLMDNQDSYVDSAGSHHHQSYIKLKTFEIFDKKRLVFDIKEKESCVSELLEAIWFCHEKHSSSGGNKSLSSQQNVEDISPKNVASQLVQNISENKQDISVLELLESLCIDVTVQKSTQIGKYVKIYTVSDKYPKKDSKTSKNPEYVHTPDMDEEAAMDLTNSHSFNIVGINSLNKRGRMSIIVNSAERGKSTFVLYVKGVFGSMKPCLRLSKKDTITLNQLGRMYRNRGLQPIIYAMRYLNEKEVLEFWENSRQHLDNFMATKRNSEKTKKHNQYSSSHAKSNVADYDELVHTLESNLRFLGCVGETKVIRQESQDLIESFLNSGVEVSIASHGSINEISDIAKRLNLMPLESDSNTFYLKDNDLGQTLDNILIHLFRDMKNGQMRQMDLIAKEIQSYTSNNSGLWAGKGGKKQEDLDNARLGSFDITSMGFDVRSNRILILSGSAFSKILKNSKMNQQFRLILFFMRRVIGYDFNIESKAKLVHAIKKHPSSKVATIGQGYNDLGMITEANIGIQFSTSDFRVNYGDLVVGDLQVLKNLIFQQSGEIYKYNLSLVLTITSANLLFGYLIWNNQFAFGIVFSNILKDNQYIILNIAVYVLCLSQQIFKIRTTLNIKSHRSNFEGLNQYEEPQENEKKKENLDSSYQDPNKPNLKKSNTLTVAQRLNSEEDEHQNYNKDPKHKFQQMDFLENPHLHFDMFYKENMIVSGLSMKYCFIFVVYNWLLSILIYSTVKYFFLNAFKTSKGYNLSEFESAFLLVLSILIVSVLRTVTVFIPSRQENNQINAWIKTWVIKLVVLLLIMILVFFFLYLINGSDFRHAGAIQHYSSILRIFVMLIISVGVPIYFDYIGSYLYDKLFLNPLRTELELNVYKNLKRFSHSLDKVKRIAFNHVHNQICIFRNHIYNLDYDKIKNSISRVKDKHSLDLTIKKIFQVDNLSSGSDISKITCTILNESKRRRYALFSQDIEKPLAFKYFLYIFIAQSLKLACLLIIGFSKDQDGKFKFNLYLNTPIPYSVIIFGGLTYHFKRTEKQRKYDTSLAMFIAMCIHILIELIASFTVGSKDRNTDLTEFEFLEVKLLTSHLNSNFIQFFILSPFFIVFKSLRSIAGDTLLYTVSSEYKARLWICLIFLLVGMLIFKHKFEYLLKIDFLAKLNIRTELEKSNEKIKMLLPPLVIERMDSYDISQNFVADDVGEITVMFCDICDFTDVVNACQDQIINILDEVFRAFDMFCQIEGVQKIETVGKTYMACGGIKSHEKTLSKEKKEVHPTKRVINVSKRMMTWIKDYEYMKGKHLKLKIGIHYGSCILGLLGFHKPQFSLIGDTVNTTARHCTTGEKSQIVLSSTAYANVQMDRMIAVTVKKVPMKGKGIVDTYILKDTTHKGTVNNTGFTQMFAKSYSQGAIASPFLNKIANTLEKASQPADAKTKIDQIFNEEDEDEFSEIDLSQESNQQEKNSDWLSQEEEEVFKPKGNNKIDILDLSEIKSKSNTPKFVRSKELQRRGSSQKAGLNFRPESPNPINQDSIVIKPKPLQQTEMVKSPDKIEILNPENIFKQFEQLEGKSKKFGRRSKEILSPTFLRSFYSNILKRNSCKSSKFVQFSNSNQSRLSSSVQCYFLTRLPKVQPKPVTQNSIATASSLEP